MCRKFFIFKLRFFVQTSWIYVVNFTQGLVTPFFTQLQLAKHKMGFDTAASKCVRVLYLCVSQNLYKGYIFTTLFALSQAQQYCVLEQLRKYLEVKLSNTQNTHTKTRACILDVVMLRIRSVHIGIKIESRGRDNLILI